MKDVCLRILKGRKCRSVFFSIVLCTSIILFSTDVLAAITVGGSSQECYQEIGSCKHDDMTSCELLVRKFITYVTSQKSDGSYGATKKFLYEDKNAWECDLKPGSWNYNTIDDVDFMIYSGHVYAKGSYVISNNSLHYYTCNSTTKYHGSGDAEERKDASNLTTVEARWGKGSAKTRWVALYTCNFLNTNDSNWNQMMQGIRVCMGFSSKMYVNSDEGKLFGLDLYYGKKMIDSFLDNAQYFQSGKVTGGVKARVIYTNATRNDTINSSKLQQAPITGSGSYYSIVRTIPGK